MKTKQIILGALLVSSMTMSSFGDDWATWLGPQANGISQETVTPSTTVAWQKELGEGYSAVAVKDGKLLTVGNINEQDIIYCLNPETGEEIWKTALDSSSGHRYTGPLGSPVTDGEKVWFFNRHGVLNCLDFATGKELWSVTLTSDRDSMPRWSICSSPVIYKDTLIVNMGGHGTAVNKNTGETVWSSPGRTNYSTPSIFTYQGKDYMVMISNEYVNVVDPVDGTHFDRYSFTGEYDIVGASPIIIDEDKGLFLVTAGYSTGRAILFAFDGAKMTEQWTVKHMNSQFSTPVYKDGVVYGCNANTNGRNALTAMDALTGEKLWSGSQRFGSPIIAGDTLIYLDERGELTFLKVDKTKEDVISSGSVLKGGKCWQMPVLANGYVYCRNSLGSLVAVKVK